MDDRLRRSLESAALEGRNVLPEATDEEAAQIEAWAAELLKWERDYGSSAITAAGGVCAPMADEPPPGVLKDVLDDG